MPFAILIIDSVEREHLRPAHQEAHYGYMQANDHRLLLRGGLQGPHGRFIGGLLVIDAATIEDARAFVEGDPYALAGLHGSVQIFPFHAAQVGDPARWVSGRRPAAVDDQ